MKTAQDLLAFAASYLGESETSGDNSSPRIDEIEKYFGMHGQQYCSMFVEYCLFTTFPGLKGILPKMPSSQTFWSWGVNQGFTSTDTSHMKPGDIVIWQHEQTWTGHVGLVASPVHGDMGFDTIEGNTSPTDKGSQSNGGGIYRKKRYANSAAFKNDSFHLRGYISLDKLLTLAQSIPSPAQTAPSSKDINTNKG